MNKFTIGQKITAKSVCDADCIFEGEVLSRTNKMITVDMKRFGIKKVRIFEFEGNEICWALGKYSMAPIFTA